MKKALLACLAIVLAISYMQAQDRTVSGTITAVDDGSTLPGVNVVVKGTTNGTVSDTEGKYTLSVSPGAVLVFSFIGLATEEVPVGDRTSIDISMKADVEQLTEVVVTAQGILKTRNELSYAAQTVSGDNLSNSRDGNFMNALSGKVAGVQIQKNNSMGGSTNVVIRGFKSLTQSNQALFVVDGVPIDNSTNNATNTDRGTAGYDFGNAGADINPDDIESTTILKGPAATALYGSRASNGVIYITTKKGRKKGLGVTLNTGVQFGTVDKSTMPKYQKEYGAGYGQYYGPGGDGYFDEADVDGDGTADFIVPTYEDASVGAPFDPNLMVYQWNAFGDPTSPTYLQKTPWVGAKNDPTDFFETAVTYNNSITIDGGGEKGFFKLGYTRNEENGIQPNSKLLKNYINFSASYEITKKLRATAAINFTDQKGRGRYAIGYGGNNNISSFREWWQANVDVKDLEAAYNRTKQNITWNWSSGLPASTGLIYWDNPYFANYENYSNDSRLRYLSYAKLDYQITDWLTAMGRVSLDSYDQIQEERTAVGSIVLPAGEYFRRNRSFKEFNYDFLLTANTKLGTNFSLKGSAGINIRRTTITGVNAQTNGGLTVPKIYALSNSINPIEAPTEIYSDKQVNGFFGDAEVGYKNFLFLNGSVRNDISSTLPKGNNSYVYFQGSTSFVFSELIPANPILTYGKIRANYAEVGADAPFNALADQYDKPTAFGSAPLFSMPGTKNNDKLVPERTKSYELGAELNFFDSRVGLDVNYFDSKTVDQIIPVAVSLSTGYNSKYVNAGTMQNKGWEVTLHGTPLIISDFKWDVSVNWTRIRNKITELYGDVTNLTLASFQASGSSNAPLNGTFGTIYGTDYIFTNGERTVNATTGRYLRTSTVTNPIGSIQPDWTGGIQNTFSYKDLALSFLVDAKHGGDVLSIDMYYGLATGLYQESVGLNELGNPIRSPRTDENKGGGGILLEGVNPDGAVNQTRLNMLDYPMAGTQTVGPTAKYVYDASYVKLREVLITYSLPSSLMARLAPLRTLSVSAVGRNLWIIHKNLPYADPEDNLGAGNVQGVQVGSLPNIRTLGFNVKASF